MKARDERVAAVELYTRAFSYGVPTRQEGMERAWWYLVRQWAQYPGGEQVPHETRLAFAEFALAHGLDDSLLWMEDVSKDEDVVAYEATVQLTIDSLVSRG